MTFRPVDFSEEKAALTKDVESAKKGVAADLPPEGVQFHKVAKEIEEFLLSVAKGQSAFRDIPVQLDTLLCTKVMNRLRGLQYPSKEQIDDLLAIIRQDLGEPVKVYVSKMIKGEK